MTTSPRQQRTISARQAVSEDNVSMDAILSALRKSEEYIFPALQEETEAPLTAAEQDLPNIVQDGHHPLPGPRTTSENGDPANEQLLENEQLLVEAVRMLLGLAIMNNAVTVRHYWKIVMSLRDKLLEAGPHEILHREAYALVLLRLLERLMPCPIQQDREYVPHPAFVPFSRPRDFVACLGMLATDMEEGFIRMHQTGTEDDVYILKNMELHTDHLSSLASRLRGA